MIQAIVEDQQQLIQRIEAFQRLFFLKGGTTLEYNRVCLEIGTLHEQIEEMNIEDEEISRTYVNQYLLTGKLPRNDFDIQ